MYHSTTNARTRQQLLEELLADIDQTHHAMAIDSPADAPTKVVLGIIAGRLRHALRTEGRTTGGERLFRQKDLR